MYTYFLNADYEFQIGILKTQQENLARTMHSVTYQKVQGLYLDAIAECHIFDSMDQEGQLICLTNALNGYRDSKRRVQIALNRLEDMDQPDTYDYAVLLGCYRCICLEFGYILDKLYAVLEASEAESEFAEV